MSTWNAAELIQVRYDCVSDLHFGHPGLSMRQHFLLLAAGLLIAVCSGCPQPAAPPPWVSYTAPDGAFTARFPKEPVRLEAPTPAGKPAIKVRATLHHEQVAFEIQYLEGINPDQATQLLAAATAAAVKGRNGALLDDRPVTLGKWEGRAVSFSAVENNVPMRHHARIYVVGARVYVLTVSGKQDLLDDGDADDFLKSFTVSE